MFKHVTRWVKPAKTVALAALLAGAATAPAAAQTAYGLSASIAGAFSLVTFQVTAPGTFTANVPITGLPNEQVLIGIDSRPATGQLYALGYNPTGTQAQLYRVNVTTGALTAVGSVQTLDLGSSSNSIGFDFNPTVDRIRVTGSNGGNFRLNPDTGAIAATDGKLAYLATDANASQTPGVGSSAYTNSFAGSTMTTLYDIDDANNRLVTQNPPNDGKLNTVAAVSVSVSQGVLPASDLDIYYNATTSQNTAYLLIANANLATFSVTSTLYTLNLTTGVATSVGTLASSATSGVGDIALALPSIVTATRPTDLASNFALYPNPLTGAASLAFGLPRTAHVELTVLDALGRPVDHLDAGQLTAGPQTIRWGRQGLAAGLYLFRLSFDGQPAGTRQVALTE